MSDMNFTIDGIPVSVPRGTTILEAAKKVNVNIPILCEHKDLCRRAICRICTVEADGGSKLLAACANSGWEGANIVTNNERLLMVRKTIVELILANHPQDCLSCIRSKTCELQTLAASYGIFASSFENDTQSGHPIIENDTLVRDMAKCVKCNRCVEVCQTVQAIGAINTSHRSHEYEISTAYKQSLNDTPCVFCGGCAAVCPVGAIYVHDQTSEVMQVFTADKKAIAQVYPAFLPFLHRQFSAVCTTKTGIENANSITMGKVIAALKLLGFDKVYDAETANKVSNSEIISEINVTKDKGKLPIISGCCDGVTRFIGNFYPDLTNHLTTKKDPRQLFSSLIKNGYAKQAEIDTSNVTSVSFVPCIAQKFVLNPDKTDFAITAFGLTRMIKTAGIEIEKLPEESFDVFTGELPKQESNTVKKETVCGYAEARKVMETIREGKCDAQWVEILSCPKGYCTGK